MGRTRGPVPAGAIGGGPDTIATAWKEAPCKPYPNQHRPESGGIGTSRRHRIFVFRNIAFHLRTYRSGNTKIHLYRTTTPLPDESVIPIKSETEHRTPD